MKDDVKTEVATREDGPNQFRWVITFRYSNGIEPAVIQVASKDAFPDEEAALLGARFYMKEQRIGGFAH